jgi:hypothetical protein
MKEVNLGMKHNQRKKNRIQDVGAVLVASSFEENTNTGPLNALFQLSPPNDKIYKASDLSSALKGVTLGPCKSSNGEGSVACLRSMEAGSW